jgi:dTDP-4-amino-4,6-dideoxygalactose transaminase
LPAEYENLKKEIDSAIQRVIESGSFVLGEEVRVFEEELAEYCGTRYAVGVGSGTAAIHLALLACGIGPGDEVITVPNTDIPTTMTISHCGADIVWVDVDGKSFNIDPDRIEEKVTERTKAILPVHLFGHPADMDPIMEVAERHDLLVIEDAALAMGAEYKGVKVGGIGDVGCFSLAPTKILGTYGDAGIVVSDNEEIANEIRILRNYGHSLAMAHSEAGTLTPRIQEWKLVAEGFNERLDALHAAIARAKLPTLDQRIARRRAAADRYNELLEELDVVTPYEAEYVKHVYRAYAILTDHRDELRKELAERGVATLVYYIPILHLQPVYEHLGMGKGDFPVAEAVSEKTLCLPMFPEITYEQIEYVVESLKACLSVISWQVFPSASPDLSHWSC